MSCRLRCMMAHGRSGAHGKTCRRLQEKREELVIRFVVVRGHRPKSTMCESGHTHNLTLPQVQSRNATIQSAVYYENT